MKKSDNETSRPANKERSFLRFMRYAAVAVVTLYMLVMLIGSTTTNDDGFVYLALFFALMLFYITIPIMGLWIYSFAKAVMRHTKTDKILLWFHIVDLLLLGVIIYALNLPSRKCDAFIMAEYYKGENGWWMRNIADRYRRMLPDSTRLVVEFENGSVPQSNALSEQDMEKLKSELEDCGCIGIEINNYSCPDYSTLRFRRIGMGMYSFRLYDRPLTRQRQNSINADECLIVYNDSTVFEFRGGVIGVQYFVGKHEFMETRNKTAPMDTVEVTN